MKIYIASDHAGFDLKKHLTKSLPENEWVDLGPQNTDRCDYPDYADLVCKKVLAEKTFGVLICGSGQGMAMRANKYSGIRAALCYDKASAELSRAHNDSNVLCLGARFIEPDKALEIFKTFINTKFEGGRHQQRVEKTGRPVGK